MSNFTVEKLMAIYKKIDKHIPQKLLKLDKKDNVPNEYKSHWLLEFRGIGIKKAEELYNAGLTDSKMLKKWLPKLPLETRIWIEYKPSFIEHNAIPKIVSKFIPKNYKVEIVGSYRREKPISGDIDLLYFDADLPEKLEKLHGDNWKVYSQGPQKISGIFRFGKSIVEIDMWIVTKENKHAMELYSTGSKLFNIRMRNIAKKKGLLLNQYGLYKGNKLIPTKTEKDIFKVLGMNYIEPKDRSY